MPTMRACLVPLRTSSIWPGPCTLAEDRRQEPESSRICEHEGRQEAWYRATRGAQTRTRRALAGSRPWPREARSCRAEHRSPNPFNSDSARLASLDWPLVKGGRRGAGGSTLLRDSVWTAATRSRHHCCRGIRRLDPVVSMADVPLRRTGCHRVDGDARRRGRRGLSFRT